MLQNLNQLIDTLWKAALVTGVGGIFLGLFWTGKFPGIDVMSRDQYTSITLVGDQKLLNEIKISGDWVYEAEVNIKDTVFFEDGCKKRLRNVHINQTSSVTRHLIGEKKK
ncbi:hypothetical protein [Nostoc sp. 'Lobaria pulmonaria (5183) cyanobiont']|uniref:hypothetical protein n=1 Tax=Nostoc sp. 'Lobaria pulmonaria (5183) cyanobiont' TaxID=1618022 RepID=UPI000CF3000B|nr:hypothetical protein [Nostoc sp. 'Lobaria pulmonaria (5183) cyanobiont']AVH71593.1 hypothetical protein NLP_3004 [Nostoc sp. 'Lobaria pulmonaria (5183) cyanobiont']